MTVERTDTEARGADARPMNYDGYPDHVTQAKCKNCNEIFYHRYHAEYCPYCGAGGGDELIVLNQGSGVVCHRAPQSQRTDTEHGDLE